MLAVLAICLPLAGCYLLQAAGGQLDVLARSRAIEEAAADPATSPETRARLALVVEARRFAVQELGLEGIMAKRADSPYRAGRTPAWLKMRSRRTETFTVVGFTAPRGSRGGFGALHVAREEESGLVYAGRVGSGFSDRQLGELSAELQKKVREKD